MTTTATPADLSADITRLLERTTYERIHDLSIGRIDLIASITNQSRFEPIDRPTVDRYVAALQEGATFPPALIRLIPPEGTEPEQLIILSGNHRTRAHIEAGRKTLDAYLIICDDLTALEIAYADNATHGLPTTEAERLAHGLILMDRGRTGAEAARTVGIHEQKLYKHLNVIKVEKRGAELGIAAEVAGLGTQIKSRLGSISEDRLFVKVARAIVDHRMGQLVAGKLIGDLNAQPDLASAMDLLQVHITHHTASTVTGRSVGRPSADPYVVLRTALGTVRGVNAADVIHHAKGPRERDDLMALCVDGVRRLMAIHDLAKAQAQR